MSLNFQSSCHHFLCVGITGIYHYACFIWCYGSNLVLVCQASTITSELHPSIINTTLFLGSLCFHWSNTKSQVWNFPLGAIFQLLEHLRVGIFWWGIISLYQTLPGPDRGNAAKHSAGSFKWYFCWWQKCSNLSCTEFHNIAVSMGKLVFFYKNCTMNHWGVGLEMANGVKYTYRQDDMHEDSSPQPSSPGCGPSSLQYSQSSPE